jgi:hypothetical protein
MFPILRHSKGPRYLRSRGGCHTKIQGGATVSSGRGGLSYINQSRSHDPASNLIDYSSGVEYIVAIV